VTQSAFAPLAGLARGVVAAALVCLLSGCGMSSLTSGIGGGLFGQSKTVTDVGSISEDQMLAAAKTDGPGSGAGFDVAYGCPRFQVWSREGYVTIYEQGRIGDGLAVMHRGEITKTARECQIEPGRVSVKLGFSGRILLGPKGKTGTVSLPLTVFVSDAKREKVVTDKVRIEVPVTLDKPIGYFSVVRSLTFNVPEGSRPAEYEVYVAFDRNTPGAG